MAPRSHLFARILISLALAGAVAFVYGQAGGFPFVHFDDDLYVLENAQVRNGLTAAGVRWAFLSTHASNWHPLTWLSHMADVELFGLDPGPHHLVNAAVHAANSVLLFLVLGGMTGALWRSAFVAAMFALHPLHVESVAWVSERKDLLCAFFWILGMGAHASYARNGGAGRYLLVMSCFALALLSKPMAVTLPFALLLLDYWPLARRSTLGQAGSTAEGTVTLQRLFLEKFPLFLLSLLSCVATYFAQAKGGSVTSADVIPLAGRIANGAISYAAYLWKTVWPASLAVIYPHAWSMPGGAAPSWQVAGAAMTVIVLSAGAILYARRLPFVATGWFWYLGTLVPVIGLVQVGVQSMADRYTYIPSIGLFLAVAWGVPELLGRRARQSFALIAAGLAVAGVLALLARQQATHWKGTVPLLEHAVAATGDNWHARNNLGIALSREGRAEEAAVQYREALRIKPDFAQARNNLGNAFARQGKFKEAIAEYESALAIEPDYANARVNLGTALLNAGAFPKAEAQFIEATRLQPGKSNAWTGLGLALLRQGRPREAAGAFREALRRNPGDAVALQGLEAATDRGPP